MNIIKIDYFIKEDNFFIHRGKIKSISYNLDIDITNRLKDSYYFRYHGHATLKENLGTCFYDLDHHKYIKNFKFLRMVKLFELIGI